MPGQTGYNQDQYQDAYGHSAPLAGPALAAGGVATAAALGTITVNATGAGTGASIAFGAGQTATDMAGSFQVTTAGTPAAGTLAVVTYNNSQPGLPKAIIANMSRTDGAQDEALAVSGITVNGFTLSTVLTLVTAKIYNVSFVVIN